MSQAVPPSGTPQYNDPRSAKAQAAADKAYKKASRPWFKKKRFILPLLLILLIILISALNAGGGDDNANTSDPAASSSADAAPAEAFPGAQDSDVIGQAGEDLALGDITVSSAALVEGNVTIGPTLCTTAVINNGSSDTIDFNLFDWKLQSPGGTILNSTIGGSDNIINSGQIVPGGSTTGDICFDNANAETGQFVVLYEPIFSFFSDRGAWINNR
jgi:hypothetical protein